MFTESWDQLHHALLFEGGEEIKNQLVQRLEELNFPNTGNPDYKEIVLESFGIDDARSLIVWAQMKPIREERKVVLVNASNLTVEAQNSLLKTLEEPVPNTHIFFVVQKARSLLPTLLSRVIFYESKENEKSKDAKNFLDASVSERLGIIKKLSKKEDKTPMKDLTREIEKEILLRSRKQKVKASVLKMVIDASRYSNIRGGSPKMILEWLATNL